MPRKIYDVSLTIEPRMARYPGSPRVRFAPKKGKTTVSTVLQLGSHAGTHIDAPAHMKASKKGIDAFQPEVFLGPCTVYDLTDAKKSITKQDLEILKITKKTRVILKTQNSSRGFKRFYEDAIYLDGEAAVYLASKGITLVGIDALSIKKRGSKDTRAHDTLLNKNIPIIEGLNLKGVPAGRYDLVSLPLKLKGLDGSPARVVLIKK